MKKILSSLLIAGLLCSLTGCRKTELNDSDPAKSPNGGSSSQTSQGSSESSEPEPEPQPTSVSLLCAGDNLLHLNIIKQAKARGGNDPSGYDFRPCYARTASMIEEADLAILNQETIITDKYEPSNYPMFCSPEAAGDQVMELGFDAISISNNHLLDKGEAGLEATLDYWKTKHPGIPVYGACLKDEEKIPVLEKNGITFAFLGFMEHTNGLKLPPDTKCKITYLSETEEVERQVRAARELADVVVVSVHYGVEVSNTVTQQQLQVTRDLVDWGADIIIGTQPHTVQPMEYVNKPDGGQAFVFYCLGNYISSMTLNSTAMVGMLGKLTVTKQPDGTIVLEDPEGVPLITHIGPGASNVTLYPWSEYTRELAAVHGTEGFTYDLADTLIKENVCIKDLLD